MAALRILSTWYFKHGMTALQLGAKHGFVSILEVFDRSLWKRCSRKVNSDFYKQNYVNKFYCF